MSMIKRENIIITADANPEIPDPFFMLDNELTKLFPDVGFPPTEFDSKKELIEKLLIKTKEVGMIRIFMFM